MCECVPWWCIRIKVTKNLPKFVTGKNSASQHWIEKVKLFLFLEKWSHVKKKENESNNSSIEYILLFVPLTQIVLLMWDVITIRRSWFLFFTVNHNWKSLWRKLIPSVSKSCIIQWWIQDFLKRDEQTPIPTFQGCAKRVFYQNIPKNILKIKEN